MQNIPTVRYVSTCGLLPILLLSIYTQPMNTEQNTTDGRKRSNIKPGIEVDIVLKKDQRTGNLTRGIVARLLTKSPNHPHGIKVMLEDGQVGRVKNIIS